MKTSKRQLALVAFSIFFAILGVYLLIVVHDSPWGLFLGAGFCLLSPALAIPAQLGPALALLKPYVTKPSDVPKS